MYLVKSLGVASAVVGPGNIVNCVANQYIIVEDAAILDFQNEPTAWTVVAGPDFLDVMLGLSGVSDAGSGSVPAASGTAGVTAADSNIGGGLHQTVFTFTDVDVVTTDAGAAGTHGSIQLLDLPAGLIEYIGATSNLAIVSDATGLDVDAELVASVGTVTTATDNATLTTTEADLIPSTVCTLTASVGAMAGKSTATEKALHDGTATAIEAFLNFAAPDADSTGNDTITVNGTVTLTWINLGDN
jgi:hypothetical protein